MNLQIDETRLHNELQTLATFSEAEAIQEDTAVTRIVFSDDDLRARTWLKGIAITDGFDYRTDAVGNTFIRLPGSDPNLPAVVTGSHIDALPHAGMYDGTVGVRCG